MSVVRPLFHRLHSLLPDARPWNDLARLRISDLLKHSTLDELGRHEKCDAKLAVVVGGVLATKRELVDGRQILCALYPSGTTIDLRPQFGRFQEELISLTDSRIVTLNPRLFEQCCLEHPDVTQAFYVHTSECLARQSDHTADLVSKTPLEKLATILLEFSGWSKPMKRKSLEHVVPIPIARTDIAQYMGLKPETVSRAIARLEKERVIEIAGRNNIAILKPVELREISIGGRPRQRPRRN